MKLAIRKGSKVRVMTGADKGREGTVLAVDIEKMRVRIEGGPPLPRARLPGVPPRQAVCARRRVNRREHPVAVPSAQRIRSGGVLRP